VTTLAIALAGAAGAVTRYRLGVLAGSTGWPWPTLAINVVGSLLAGLVLGLAATRLSATTSAAITVGFLGAFTTFSALSVQTVTMLRDGRAAAAGAYVVGSVVLGLAAAYAGLRLGERLAGS
jgi:CrcB protein